MGYTNYLSKNISHEWKEHYIDYESLKKALRQKEKKKKNKRKEHRRNKKRDNNLTDNNLTDPFTSLLAFEIEKVNRFYEIFEKKIEDEKINIFQFIKEEIGGKAGKVIEEIEMKDKKLCIEKRESGFDNTYYVEKRESGFDNTSEGNSNNNNSINSHNSNFTNNINSNFTNRFFKLNPLTSMFSKRRVEKELVNYLHTTTKLRSFKDVNIAGFKSIIKRYSKMECENTFETRNILYSSTFYQSKKLDLIKKDIKLIYRKIFSNKDHTAIFRRIKKGIQSSDLTHMISGFFYGMNTMIMFYFINSVYNLSSNIFSLNNLSSNIFSSNNLSSNFNKLLAISFFFLGAFLFGMCLKTFKYFKINYKFIFNFNYSSSMNNPRFLLAVSLFHFLFLIPMIWNRFFIGCIPFLIFLFNPTETGFYESRCYFFSSIFKSVKSIQFRNFYFIDVAQSFSYSFKIILESLCIKKAYFFMSLFYAIRIFQCIKRSRNEGTRNLHLANGMKYLIGLTLLYSKEYYSDISKEHYSKENDFLKMDSFFLFIILLSSVNFLFTISWDFFIDWCLIRNTFMYPKFVYWVIGIFNFIVRILPIIFLFSDFNHVYLTALLEIVRRFGWTLIRVELEHLNNCDKLNINKIVNLAGTELFYNKNEEQNNAESTEFTDVDETDTNDKHLFDTTCDENNSNDAYTESVDLTYSNNFEEQFDEPSEDSSVSFKIQNVEYEDLENDNCENGDVNDGNCDKYDNGNCDKYGSNDKYEDNNYRYEDNNDRYEDDNI